MITLLEILECVIAGKNVIADGESSESATEASKDEDKKTRGAEAPEVSAAGLSNAVSSSTAGNGPTTGGGSSDAGSVSGSGREGTPVSSAPTTDDSSSRKAKYEFFHMIAQTVDGTSNQTFLTSFLVSSKGIVL